MLSFLLRTAAVILALCSAHVAFAQREKLPEEDLAIVEKNWPNAKKDSSGIRYIVEQMGHGQFPMPGDVVSVNYAGRLLNGETFDQSIDPAKPFTFRVGRDSVIQGWDYMIQQMRTGERRLVIIPPELAYGTRGQPGRIPRDATLVFMIELIGIKRE